MFLGAFIIVSGLAPFATAKFDLLFIQTWLTQKVSLLLVAQLMIPDCLVTSMVYKILFIDFLWFGKWLREYLAVPAS